MSVSSGNITLAWVLLAIGLVIAVAGGFLGLYGSISWFDEVIHLYNFFALTLLLSLYLYGAALTGAEGHAGALVFVVALIGFGLGGIWEIVEWVYDAYLTQGNTIKAVPDRLIDLSLDGLGGLIAGFATLSMAKDR